MAVVKNRLLLMLYLLDNSDQPLQARQLAAMAGVSERTVKMIWRSCASWRRPAALKF